MNLHNNHTGGLDIFGFTGDIDAGIKGEDYGLFSKRIQTKMQTKVWAIWL